MADQARADVTGVSIGARLREPEWRCFHCDEVFTDKAQAQEHFGEYLDDSPMCLIKGQDGGLAARIRELEKEVLEAYNQRNEYENDARLWYESEADRVRRIGHVQWWQEMDSREGEKLVLQERIKELEATLGVGEPPQPTKEKEIIPKCPRCSSPSPDAHPLADDDGDVRVCPDAFHQRRESHQAAGAVACPDGSSTGGPRATNASDFVVGGEPPPAPALPT